MVAKNKRHHRNNTQKNKSKAETYAENVKPRKHTRDLTTAVDLKARTNATTKKITSTQDTARPYRVWEQHNSTRGSGTHHDMCGNDSKRSPTLRKED